MLKRIGFLFSSGLLKITLFSLALAGAGWMTFGTPDSLKKAADESNVYQSAVDGIIDEAKKDAEAQAGSGLPLEDPAIQQVAKDAFPPELLSANSESIIDGVYGWLQGKTAAPEFSVDLTEAKQQLANGVANYAKQRYEGLPPCTFEQIRAIDPNNIDAFATECRVPGVGSDSIQQRVLAEIQNSEGFMNDSSFTADDLPKDGQGRTVAENLSGAPDAYQLFKSLPWILGALALLFAAGVFLLSESKRKGLRSLGITLFGTGAFLLIGQWFIGWSFKQMASQPQTEALQSSLINALSKLVNVYTGNLLKFTLAYLLVGAGILFTLWFQGRQQNTSALGQTANKK